MRSTVPANATPSDNRTLLAVCSAWLVSTLLGAPVYAVDFTPRVLDAHPGKVVYAVTIADINSDGADDIVCVTESRVLCYEAPDWRARVLLDGVTQTDNVCVAPLDIDRDGHVDLALGAGWPTQGGTIQWLSRGENIDDPWQLYPITSEPWTHRMRWADVLGKGEPQLVVSPLNASVHPGGVRLLALEIPGDPRVDRWKPTLLNSDLNRMHNHWCVAPDELGMPTVSNEQRPVTLTASVEGISVISPDPDAQHNYRRLTLLPGADGDEPSQRGVGEVKLGQLADGTKFLATIEPMHGTHAVVYLLQGALTDKSPERTVLTDKLLGGHAVWCADIDRDGSDEIVVGYRDANPAVGILLYDRQHDGSWTEQRVGNEVACEDLVVEDVNGDGWPDIIAGGRATHNLVLYLNRGGRTQPIREHE
ncbi:FG-GAP repeat domain-containing protein [Allorhodopirellula heiligendammensis]|uniref:FG-GAP repeat protein n=1 Tax=Allorhodopirellula heiligendammensis TaxID=2714739 RepID=A0A5C6BFF3_9BACT|nr:VCBS repeat-containing protein [Allorhodopirellula heiligendammensis]TWU10221.1 FG-GAP repeat protein [Allorhodopirellula heiligendammensis]